jgi:hypothetical protein
MKREGRLETARCFKSARFEYGGRHAKPGQRRDEDTVRNVFRQSDLLDLEPTPAYTFRFLKDGLFGGPGA